VIVFVLERAVLLVPLAVAAGVMEDNLKMTFTIHDPTTPGSN